MTPRSAALVATVRTGPSWTVQQVEALFEMPLLELLWRAQQVHRQHFAAGEVQLSTLLSI